MCVVCCWLLLVVVLVGNDCFVRVLFVFVFCGLLVGFIVVVLVIVYFCFVIVVGLC